MTENMWSTDIAKQRVQHLKSHWGVAQIVCHSTLQVILFGLITSLLTVGFVLVDYQADADAYERGDYETAFQNLGHLTEDSNPKAQFHLGQMYAKGNGIPQDEEKE